MIKKEEILNFARSCTLSPHTIEKDYVLGWMLAALSSQTEITNTWVFKGGTCIKKCYFADYRFSEDLDFTLLDPSHINEDFLTNLFSILVEWLDDHAEIEVINHSIRFELYQNPSGETSARGFFNYRGPLRQRTNHPKIKLDLNASELLVNEPEKRKIIHTFSDVLPTEGITCYTFNELFSEKLRALIDRLRPRDLYDVVYLFTQKQYPLDQQRIQHTLEKKCSFKGIPYPSIDTVTTHRFKKELHSSWESMLRHQLFQLEEIERYWDALPKIFDWIKL